MHPEGYRGVKARASGERVQGRRVPVRTMRRGPEARGEGAIGCRRTQR